MFSADLVLRTLARSSAFSGQPYKHRLAKIPGLVAKDFYCRINYRLTNRRYQSRAPKTPATKPARLSPRAERPLGRLGAGALGVDEGFSVVFPGVPLAGCFGPASLSPTSSR